MNYLIPANTKKGELFLGIFRGFDLILFGVGILLTLVLLVSMPMNDTMQVVLVMLPAGICTFLIIPVPNYHNMLTVISELIEFLLNQRSYKWKGWCIRSGNKK